MNFLLRRRPIIRPDRALRFLALLDVLHELSHALSVERLRYSLQKLMHNPG